jgi:8-oxo-dGTP diphosphatase
VSGTHYVAGFAFDYARERVILIRKNRPAWQAGKLNGVGGHIESGESARGAMLREFEEETAGGRYYWDHFATVQGHDWGSVHFFRTLTDAAFRLVQSTTDEQVEIHRIADIPWDECLPNLSWLIPLALYNHDFYEPVIATECRA